MSQNNKDNSKSATGTDKKENDAKDQKPTNEKDTKAKKDEKKEEELVIIFKFY